VPPSARANTPGRAACAPVKAPLTWPNSSLSSTPAASALQLTATNGWPTRSLCQWIARATSSLPVPDSPVISTVALLRAARRASSSAAVMAGLPEMMASGLWRDWSWPRR
jgi:hypothetical protein